MYVYISKNIRINVNIFIYIYTYLDAHVCANMFLIVFSMYICEQIRIHVYFFCKFKCKHM